MHVVRDIRLAELVQVGFHGEVVDDVNVGVVKLCIVHPIWRLFLFMARSDGNVGVALSHGINIDDAHKLGDFPIPQPAENMLRPLNWSAGNLSPFKRFAQSGRVNQPHREFAAVVVYDERIKN